MYNTTDTNKFSTLGTEYTPTYMNGYGTGEIYWINDDEPSVLPLLFSRVDC